MVFTDPVVHRRMLDLRADAARPRRPAAPERSTAVTPHALAADLARQRIRDLHADRTRTRRVPGALAHPLLIDRRAVTAVAALATLVAGLLLGPDGADAGWAIVTGGNR